VGFKSNCICLLVHDHVEAQEKIIGHARNKIYMPHLGFYLYFFIAGSLMAVFAIWLIKSGLKSAGEEPPNGTPIPYQLFYAARRPAAIGQVLIGFFLLAVVLIGACSIIATP
jgi:hypothetical protein